MAARLKAIPRWYGTIHDLSKRTGLHVRRLYRLRDRGVFVPALRMNSRAVYYNVSHSARAIQKYMRARA